MEDLMRAKDIIDEIKKHKEAVAGYLEGPFAEGYRKAHDHIVEVVQVRVPTVDAVEVVRCKDCKYCEYPAPNVTKHRCSLFDRCVIADWFCASAERKDNGNA